MVDKQSIGNQYNQFTFIPVNTLSGKMGSFRNDNNSCAVIYVYNLSDSVTFLLRCSI